MQIVLRLDAGQVKFQGIDTREATDHDGRFMTLNGDYVDLVALAQQATEAAPSDEPARRFARSVYSALGTLEPVRLLPSAG